MERKVYQKINLNKSAIWRQKNTSYFDTILVEVEAEKLKTVAEKNNINFNYVDENHISISINETVAIKEIKAIVNCFEEAFNLKAGKLPLPISVISENVKRKTSFLENEIFNTYQSETDMMRYIKKLERKDLALNHSMISLGSCTMKLNAASEMLPLSNPQWGNIHPFVPLSQAEGYQIVLQNLEQQLNVITGFAGTSLQPNSGAQGEFAGLMTIRAYHQSNGDHHRNICLIPASAHGTNPASAVMAGMKVVVTKTDEKGNIDVEDLREKATLHKDNLAAIMVTYPSTHGVYEKAIMEITQIIHDNGGQVYMDGANMNAQVGLTNPATIGADVCHLNLHKTFAIPHGGGGPGVGPICVAPQLVPFLPTNPVVATGGNNNYSYSWSNGVSSEDVSNLYSGTYTVTVTDQNNCSVSESITITQPSAVLSISDSTITEPLGEGLSNGSIATTVTGGTPSYSYAWYKDTTLLLETSSTLSNIGTGTYKVIVTDANNCSIEQNFTVNEPSGLNVSLTSQAISCYGETGSITATVTGGYLESGEDYSYKWYNSSNQQIGTTATIANLVSGSYYVIVRDSNGIEKQKNYTFEYIVTKGKVFPNRYLLQ